MESHLIESLIGGIRPIRQFTEKVPDKAVLTCMFDAVRISPSAENAQPWRYYVLSENERDIFLQTIKNKKDYTILKTAPILCAVIAKKVLFDRRSSEMRFYQIDIPISILQARLAALERGFDLYYTCDADGKKVLSLLNPPFKSYFFCLSGIGEPLYENDKSERE